MKQLNAFNQIHKGLRASLYDCAIALQQANFLSATETEVVSDKLKEVLMLFEEHASKEDHYILPAIAAFEPSVVDSFEQEHDQDHQLAENLKAALEALQRLTTAEERIEAGYSLNNSFVAFMVFNLQHMAKEEKILNELLWRYYSDEEIIAIQQRIVRETSPWHNDFFSKWMLRGINNHEAINWLKAVERTAPPVVFQTLHQKAEQELPEERFRQIEKAIQEEPVLA